MKKFFTFVAAALVAFTMNAQFATVSPAEGEVLLSINESGISGMNFTFSEKAEVNRDANKFVTLLHNDEPIAMVPASNTKQISFDSAVFGVWQVAFFLSANKAAMQPGDYKVVFDEGLFLLGEDKRPMPRTELNYFIKAPQYSITPEGGQKMMSLQDFTLIFNCKEVRRNPEKHVAFFDVYAVSSDGETFEYITPTEDIDKNIVYLFLTNEVTNPGTWRLEVEAGAYILVMEDGTEVECEEIDETWVVPNYLGGLPTVDPAPGDIEYFPGEIYLHLPEGLYVNNVNSMEPSWIWSVDENGQLAEKVARYQGFKVMNDLTVVRLVNLNGADTKFTPAPGKYRLVTGQMLYSVIGKVGYQSSMTYNYNVVDNSVNYIITPDPSEPVASLNDICIEFPDADEVEVINSNYSWLSNSLSNYQFWPSVEGNTVKFHTAVDVTYPGQYTLLCNATTIAVEGVYISINPVFTVTGDAEGVDKVSAELPEVFDIYSIDGTLVRHNATSIADLPKGLYIAAGKKIIVK